jgi:hypothetical protein
MFSIRIVYRIHNKIDDSNCPHTLTDQKQLNVHKNNMQRKTSTNPHGHIFLKKKAIHLMKYKSKYKRTFLKVKNGIKRTSWHICPTSRYTYGVLKTALF